MTPTEQEIQSRCDALYTTHYRRGFSREEIHAFYNDAYAAGLREGEVKGLKRAKEQIVQHRHLYESMLDGEMAIADWCTAEAERVRQAAIQIHSR